jgi:hypothetical protein
MDGDRQQPEKRARRSGSEKRRSGRFVAFRMTAEDYAELASAAERESVSLGAYIRSRLLPVPRTRQRRRPSVEVAALAKLLAEMHRSGSNVNQVARHLNFGEAVLEHEIRDAIGDWRKAVAEVMAVLGRGKP